MATQNFNQIFEREKNRILGFVAKNVSDFAEAEDITQEVFSQFYEAYDVMKPIENTSAWLYRMAKNKIVDLFRKRKTRQNYEDGNSLMGKDNTTPEDPLKKLCLNKNSKNHSVIAMPALISTLAMSWSKK